MAGQKFQYDESGGTFYYFVLSFLALLLLPSTYYLWPQSDKKDRKSPLDLCKCPACKKKQVIINRQKPWKLIRNFFLKLAIVTGWCLIAFLTYKVSQFDYEYSNFDPYDILGVPMGSTDATVKKAYRRLSLIFHPDKETGNEKAFMKLTKAYQALTDEESRRNWEKYGNPDGPGAMGFGIALPAWIVEKENSVWVLGLYALVFMVALPVTVGTWWYKSIKYSSDKVLLDTTRMYYYFFHKTPTMPLKRVIMILGASLEFEKKYNSEIIERESDMYEMRKLIACFNNLGEKNRERPLYYRYSIKARALIYAHLQRLQLNPETLDIDRINVLKKCPTLIQEMINCISQLILLAYAQRVPRLLSIETLENCMKLCSMIVQAQWEYKSPLLQLPHIQEEHMKHFVLRKRYIRNVQQFARLSNEDKRSMVRFLKDDQFQDILNVISTMPAIEFHVRCEVIDDEASTVYTAGAIVTVTVTLTRRKLGETTMSGENPPDESSPKKQSAYDEPENNNDKENGNKENAPPPADNNKKGPPNKPVWQKNKKTGKKGNKKPKKQGKPNAKKKGAANVEKKKDVHQKESASSGTAAAAAAAAAVNGDADNNAATAEETRPDGEKDKNDHSDSSSDSNGEDSSAKDAVKGKKEDKKDDSEEEENSDNEGSDDSDDRENKKMVADDDDDDDSWDKFQSGMNRKDRVLEGRRKQSHSVHCPYFPEDKQEYWWVYISDRKSKTLLTAPYYVTELVDYDEIQLKFTAPKWPGVYTFTVCLRSDSYIGFDQMHDIKLDVKEAPEVPTEHPQWDISDDEEDDRNRDSADDSISEFTTDEDVEEY